MIKKEQIDVVLESLRLGLNICDSCQRAKVARQWFYDKQKADKKFAEQVEDALLSFKLRNIAIIQKAANKSWTAGAWLLERKYPEEYALRQRLEHSGPQGGPIPVATAFADLSKMDFKAIEKLGDKIDAFLRPAQTKNDDI